jgi:alkyl sulfatase BDS1-like metallo-beta-lactamase superfamily hydrolase
MIPQTLYKPFCLLECFALPLRGGVLLALLLFGTSNALLAQSERPFYRGGLDDQKATAPNGAIVNADYKRFLLDGPFAKTRTVAVRDGVHTIVGYSISNYTFIEGKTGLIAFDTGQSVGMGAEVMKMIRKITDKPIVAIIYSHHHYTGGAKAYAAQSGGRDVPVYAHPDVDRNLLTSTGALGPMQMRRAGIQLGFYLPHQGPDAVLGPAEPVFEDPKLSAVGHLPVTYPVKDGAEVVVDGVEAVFYHAVADTTDSVIVHFPELDLVLHNTAVTPMAFSLYTLRGDYYREPTAMIASIDKLRTIRPKYLVGCHGVPITDRDEAYEIATAHRDAYAFIYNQSVRAINRGMTPDEMASTIRLPKHLEEHPWLFPAYVDNEYNVRGQYRGLVGWYHEDTADLHPPSTKELGAVMIEGFGGSAKVIASARKAFEEKKYNLTAKLLSYVLAVEPDNKLGRQLKADALRAMAQTTRSGIQTRNFLLTHALHLEGKLDWTKPPEVSFFGAPTAQNILATPPGTYLKLLETYVDPQKSADVQKIARVTFSDLGKSWALHVRRGVAEVTETIPDEVDAAITLPRLTWAQIVLRQKTLDEAVKSGKATVGGDKKALAAIVASFNKASSAKPDPHELHN